MILLLVACLQDLGERSAAELDACGSCHPEHQADFDQSRHAMAADSTLFQRLRDEAEAELGAGSTCDGCHQEAFTCATCHTAAANQGTSQGRLLHDPRGPVRAARDLDGTPHATAASDFLVDSALCGTCHDVEAPQGFAERPYQAWLDSPAAARGDTCQTCHQPPTTYGTSHRFQGIQDGSDAAIDLLRRGVALRWRGDELELENLTGHRFPDGASSVRELRLVPDQGVPVELHAALAYRGAPVDDPVLADERIERGLEPGATRGFRFDDATQVCLVYRAQNEALTDQLGLPAQPERTVTCISR